MRVMAAKGLDTGDKVLAKAVAGRLIASNAVAGLLTGRRSIWERGFGLCQRNQK